MTDPIGDMLIRIKNGYLSQQKMVLAPYSKIKKAIAQLLLKEGYLSRLKHRKQVLELSLKYEKGKPALSGLKRVSKPGRRVYLKTKEIKPVRSGFGISLISTPLGVTTNREAKKKNLGGEIIAEIW